MKKTYNENYGNENKTTKLLKFSLKQKFFIGKNYKFYKQKINQ